MLDCRGTTSPGDGCAVRRCCRTALEASGFVSLAHGPFINPPFVRVANGVAAVLTQTAKAGSAFEFDPLARTLLIGVGEHRTDRIALLTGPQTSVHVPLGNRCRVW